MTGLGEDIFFEFTENSSEKKISGSISNWLSIFRKERNLENFNFSIMGLNIHEIIPEIKFVRTSGPIKMKLYSSIENGKNILGGKVDLSLAKVTFPNFSIDKKKNQFGELAFKLLNQNRARFSYKQKNVTLRKI